MQVDWTQAPPWAYYAAQDPNGGWWWFECAPRATPSGWVVSDRNLGTRVERITGAAPDWRKSVSTRPAA
ncbi:MAG: hypothetical protein RSE94_11730 [Pseudomonas sp.]